MLYEHEEKMVAALETIASGMENIERAIIRNTEVLDNVHTALDNIHEGTGDIYDILGDVKCSIEEELARIKGSIVGLQSR